MASQPNLWVIARKEKGGDKMRTLLAALAALVIVALGIWVGGYIFIFTPVMAFCVAIDTNTVTAALTGLSILECLAGLALLSISFYLGFFAFIFIKK